MFFQKPLRRVDISEVGEKKASKEDFSQLSASPVAKITKIEELLETATQSSNLYVVLPFC